MVPAASWTLGALLALLLAQALRIPIYDFLGQLQYREKFGLFLVHATLWFAPRVFGLRGWEHAWAAVLVLLCLQTVHRVGFGRVYAVCAVLAVTPCVLTPLPPFVLFGGWMLALLLAFRAEHVRFRLEAYGKGPGLPVGVGLWETARSVLMPWLAGAVAWGAYVRLQGGEVRRLTLNPPPVEAVRSDYDPASLKFDLIVLAGMIILSVVALAWLERKLRLKRPGGSASILEPVATTEGWAVRKTEEEPPPFAPVSADARGRVLERFHWFASRLARLGFGRGDGETVGDYFRRLGRAFPPVGRFAAWAATVFDRACYSQLEVADKEADQFDGLLGAEEKALRKTAQDASKAHSNVK